MGVLSKLLDGPRTGTLHEDRMLRILKVCQDCGVAFHMERVTYRNGATESVRVDDVVSGGKVLVTPQYAKYALRVNPRVLSRMKGLAQQFAYALNVPNTTVEIDGNLVYVRVPRAQARSVTFDPVWRMAKVPAEALLLGLDDSGQQLVLPLTSARPHCAVVGMSGSGKSTLMLTMILSALKNRQPVALFDPIASLVPVKGLAPMSGYPVVWRGGIWIDPEQCALALASLVAHHRGGRLFVFVDEVPDLIMQAPGAKSALTRIAQRGRHTGLHLIMGAQHPLASELPAMRNVSVRLVGQVADRQASYNATGLSDVGAEALRGGGDFVAIVQGRRSHFQAAMISPADLIAWMATYPPRKAREIPRPGIGQDRPIQTEEMGGMGQAGRPMDGIDQGIIDAIREYEQAHGEQPSNNWVYDWTREHYGQGYGRDKARRALALAEETT